MSSLEFTKQDLYRINNVKKKARSELKNWKAWKKMNYYYDFDPDLQELRRNDNMPRIDYENVSEKEFIETYEKANEPVVILNAMKDWRALTKWNMKDLYRKYRNQAFRVGEDDDGNSVKMKFKYFYKYCMINNKDDSPLYIFDSTFGEHYKKKQLLYDYMVPKYFTDDLLKHAGDHRRPPYRWMVIGPARSGTGIHIDPLNTSAWNSLVQGHKWWVLFPPKTPKSALKLTSEEAGKNKSEGISWFMLKYPKCKSKDWPVEWKPREILQEPGETVFVPLGWWHVVINLDMTIAVTQNFCNATNFSLVFYKCISNRPKLTKAWHKRLKIIDTSLANKADEVLAARQKNQCYSDCSSSSSSTDSSKSDSDSDSTVSQSRLDRFSLSDDDDDVCEAGNNGGKYGTHLADNKGEALNRAEQKNTREGKEEGFNNATKECFRRSNSKEDFNAGDSTNKHFLKTKKSLEDGETKVLPQSKRMCQVDSSNRYDKYNNESKYRHDNKHKENNHYDDKYRDDKYYSDYKRSSKTSYESYKRNTDDMNKSVYPYEKYKR